VLKYGRARQTLRMCNTRCFSTATMVMQTPLNVVHTLPAHLVESTLIWLYNLKFVKSMKLHVNIRNIHFFTPLTLLYGASSLLPPPQTPTMHLLYRNMFINGMFFLTISYIVFLVAHHIPICLSRRHFPSP
jgi:hypothetical protein